MKRKIKTFFQLLLAIFLATLLVGLAGLWRLSITPVRFDSHSPILRHIPDSLQFSEIFLRAGKFYTIPELELRDVHFKTDEVDIKALKLFATWNLWEVLRGDFSISSVCFERADVAIDPRAFSQSTDNTPLGQKLAMIFKDLPVKQLLLRDSKISFSYEGLLNEITQVDMNISKFSRTNTFQLSGFLEKGVTHPFAFKIKGHVNTDSYDLSGEISCEKIVPAELPLPSSIKEHVQFYSIPVDIKVDLKHMPQAEVFYFNGTIKVDALNKGPRTILISGETKDKDQFLLTIESPRVAIEDLPKLWPPVGVAMRKWVLDSILAGIGQNINLTFLFENQKEKGFVLTAFSGEVDIEEASIRYVKDLLLAEGVKAHVSFTKQAASVAIHQAQIKDLKIVNSQISFSKLQEDIPHLKGDLHFFGPFPTLIGYLNSGFLKKYLPVKIKAKQGEIKGQVSLALPLQEKLSPTDVSIMIDAHLKNGDFLVAHNNQNLDLKNTELNFYKTKDKLKIAGVGTVEGFKSSFLWEENYNPESLVKSRKQLKGSGSFKGFLKILPSTIHSYVQTQKGGDVLLAFSSEENKEGITKINLNLDADQTNLSLPLFNWTNLRGEEAKLEIDIETKNDRIHQFNQLSFLSKNLKIKGKARFDDQGRISEVYFDPILINGLTGAGKAAMRNGIWDVEAQIPFLNFKAALGAFQSSSSESHPKKEGVSLNLNLKINTLFLKKNYGYKDLALTGKIRQNELHFLKITGYDQSEPFSIRYEPLGDQMILEAELPKLDTLLQGLEISDQVHSKKVTIQAAKPLKDLERPIKGKLFISELKILNVPAFAKLLSLISIEGLVRTLSGTGLVFDDNYAKFEYKNQKIALRRAHIMNSSIGVTAQGYVDLKNKTLDLEGVLVPANFLNQLFGKIPIIGTLLTGGKDKGLFSVSYVARGDLKKPEIKSNPLGVVAPNILKSLFGDLTGTKKEKPTLVG